MHWLKATMYASSKIKRSFPGDLIRNRKRQQKWEGAVLDSEVLVLLVTCGCIEHTKDFLQMTNNSWIESWVKAKQGYHIFGTVIKNSVSRVCRTIKERQ
jgi:hypothetical protein